jgi:hypothetical protein
MYFRLSLRRIRTGVAAFAVATENGAALTRLGLLGSRPDAAAPP